MPSSSQITRIRMVVFVLAALTRPVYAGDDPVVVRLVDGSRVKAQIDQRTDGDRLWLTTLLERGRVSQSIPWQDVLQIEIAGRSYEGWVAQAAVASIREQEPQDRNRKAQQRPESLDVEPFAGSVPSRRPSVTPRDLPNPRVEAMQISARLANWDQDVAEDGLLVELVPYDSYGNPIACDGVVDFTLRAWKASARGSGLGTHTERWSKAVRAADFESGSVFFRLPFRAIEPHQSSEWWAHGALEARLTVPGSGVVQRTLADLRLRQFEPVRDTLEQRAGTRYFSSENVRREAWSRP